MDINALLEGKGENHIFPFFWQHGEDEKTLRTYMDVIEKSNCGAVCVESRPHPDFCGKKWWRDMDIILDEAKKRGMKVWILDDSHFPTGYANGAALKAPLYMRRQSVYCRTFSVKKGKRQFHCSLKGCVKKIPKTLMGSIMSRRSQNHLYQFDDDRLLGVSVLLDGERLPRKVKAHISGDRISAELPENTKKVYVTFLTRNAGIHRSYINMLEKDAVRLLIDAVYEPHWAHYQEEFGKTIAGFFSDEPELGNGNYFNVEITVGKDADFPWSKSLEASLKERLGTEFVSYLPLLWENEGDAEETAKVRYQYMDAVTRLVEQNFSKQIGSWCDAHGVQYIGHVIEDNNQHARLGGSLGHYFRGLSGQHMAGIDDIGGQVLPQKEDAPAEGFYRIIGGRDGEFYHYALGKLGASYGAIDPRKNGNCMCEIFGAYGWGEGPRLEKFLADHFMVNGINYYVPHAFSPKKYPDKDCPPHFYAHGHNPQYRHFGQVIAYMNRICALISDGKSVLKTAILYHGEAEWMGKRMLMQKPARILMENQVDFHFVPIDIFSERDRYRTQIDETGLTINGNHYTTLIVPYMQYVPSAFFKALKELQVSGCNVIFVDGRPEGVSDGAVIPAPVADFTVCKLNNLLDHVEREIVIQPSSPRLRSYHYIGREEIYYFVNEDAQLYKGTVRIPHIENCYAYDVWNNRTVVQMFRQDGESTILNLCLKAGESCIVVVGEAENPSEPIQPCGEKIPLNKTWRQSACKAIEYPEFQEWKKLQGFTDYGKKNPHFSGYLAYETIVRRQGGKKAIIEIEDAGEDVEVFVNGKSLGLQVLPPFYYDVTEALTKEKNLLRIEVATTPERENKGDKKKFAPIGILGDVNLYLS